MALIEDRIAALASMTSAQLRSEWRLLARTEAPNVGRKLLALAVACRLQEKELGGLNPTIKRELNRLGTQYAKIGKLAIEPSVTLKAGSRLCPSSDKLRQLAV